MISTETEWGDNTKALDKHAIAKRTAELLWQIGAVNFNADTPYQFASGIKSPIYMNCRTPIFYPKILQEIIHMAVGTISPIIKKKNISVLAGGETAGIPYAMYLAREFMLPMVYVRKKPKGYGMNAAIEGGFKPAAATLLIEDLATNGGSKINFINSLEQAEFICQDAFVLFYYNIFPLVSGMQEKQVELHYLTTAQDVLTIAQEKNFSDLKTLGQIAQFLENPTQWSESHGGGKTI